MGTIKTGYMRITGAYEQMVSFKEVYSYSEASLKKMRDMQRSGEIQLFCACCPENTLPLQITSDYKIRVMHNNKQELHLDSCPKSIHYAKWLQQNNPGMYVVPGAGQEDGKPLFYLSLPAIFSRKKPEKEESEKDDISGMNLQQVLEEVMEDEKKKKEPKEKAEVLHRSKIMDMVRFINFHAWQLQQYSIKKQIKEAYQKGLHVNWQYKNRNDFLRLFFGVCNDILIQVGYEQMHLSDICYKPSIFYATQNDFRFFMCAEIERISEFKEERKYQYVTVRMPSNRSKYRSVVRIPTETYLSMRDILDTPMEGAHQMIAGYIYHSVYQNRDGSISEWISFLKGEVFYVTDYGLLTESAQVTETLNDLCRQHILFTRPAVPLQNYGGYTPTILIERYKEKHLILDFVTEKEKKRRLPLIMENPEYEVHLYSEGEKPVIKEI